MLYSFFSVNRIRILHAILGFCLFSISATSGATDRTWDGQSDSFWANGINWSANVAPVAGDNLIFPSGSILPSITTNNYPAGTAFGSITISSTSLQGYTLGGNRITLNGGLSYSANQLAYAPLIACDITLGADQLFSSTRGVTIASRLDLNNHFLTIASSSTGNFFLSGRVTNSAAPYAYVTKTNTGTLTIPSGALFQVPCYYDTNVDWPSLGVINGTLRLDGVATNGNSTYPVKVRVWSLGVVTGTGLADVVEVFGGTLSPGVNGPGVFHCNNVYPFAGSGVLQLDINGTTPGTEYDQIVTGGYPGWNGTLDLRFGYSPQIGDTFYVMVPAAPIGNTFTGSGIIDHTNGCSFGTATSRNGFSIATLRRPESPFSLWKGSVSGTFPFIYYSTMLSPTNNWAAGVGPTTGARLVFDEYGLNSVPLTNDLTSAYSLASLTFDETNGNNTSYILYGNPLMITEGITNRTQGSNSLILDVVAAGPLTFDIDDGGSLLFANSFNGGGTVHKTGGGLLRCTGTTTPSSFVGTFALDGGILRVDGTLNAGDISVTAGMLSGTGHVAGVSMTGGVLNPGITNGGAGILYLDGNLNAGSGAVCRFDLNSPIAGSGYDQVQVNGSINLNGATLDIVPNYPVTIGSVFLLVLNDGSDAITGTFAGLPQGAVFQAGGQWFSISYQSGAGANDVVLTRVDAPALPGNFSNISFVSSNNTVQLQGQGASNVSYTIQANTNLATTNWLDIGTAPSDGSGHFLFNATNVTLFPQRFFRTKSP